MTPRAMVRRIWAWADRHPIAANAIGAIPGTCVILAGVIAYAVGGMA